MEYQCGKTSDLNSHQFQRQSIHSAQRSGDLLTVGHFHSSLKLRSDLSSSLLMSLDWKCALRQLILSCSLRTGLPCCRRAYRIQPRVATQKLTNGGFPGGAVVESLPANAGDTGSGPGLGRSHMPRSSWAREPQLLSLRVWSLFSATREAAIVRGPRTAMKSGPRLPQLGEALAQKRRPNAAINK